ncbi:histone-lysine N-methyltransferase 2C-like [Nerophis lumbriciformis]|uniref:histone-lysine N-methyltransferase 2C-like n=1 Tax=Nerophis lumbriciformis TaxID=546530 RepID=UPI003BABDD61
MPSEAPEPRDRGPPPPVTRAGRSAQLAKAAAEAAAAASERRPRGRPRKDGIGGRAAPPAPPPAPPPPPPPPPKSRKKGRNRGQAQVEDEESMETTEKRPSPDKKIEDKEVAPGRRRSASKRRSITNPDSDPAPIHPEPPAVPSDEEDQSPPAPLETPPISSVEEESQRSPAPQPPSLDISVHSPKPGPDAVEEKQPCLASMEGDHAPVPIKPEGGGPSSLGQSPTLSLGSSPAASPCLRLEDEDSLSPLFQRSMSDDSGGSPTPSLGHTKKRLKQCAFCYHGNQPPLGQGPLVVFGPTPGYIPLHILNRRESSDRDSDCHDHCYRSNQAPTPSSSPSQCEDESFLQLVAQLGPIGLPHDVDVQTLFDPTGQCCAHLQCAAWSEGVCRGEGQSLLYVDKAIDSGSTQACAFCHQLGASLRCRETGCGRSYHFPCAAAAGAHQDWEQRHTLCTRHAQAASPSCLSCSRGDDVGNLLMCCCCGNKYHGGCLTPPLTPSSLIRAGWQCLSCQVCQCCRLQEDTSLLLVCGRCDKAYHTHCLTPPLDHTRPSGWTCQNCRVCLRCGVRSSGQWANHPFLCESCDPALPCALCGNTPDLYSPQDYVTCVCCYRCVHKECIVQAEEDRTKSDGYICSTCQPVGEELTLHTPIPHSPALDLQLSPTKAPDIYVTPPSVQSPAEVLPIVHGSTAQSPVRIVCLDHAPTVNTEPSHESLIQSQPENTELNRSPKLSPSGPTELKPSSPFNHAELQHSSAPSPNPVEQRLSPVPSPSNPTEPQQIQVPSPKPIEQQISPVPSSISVEQSLSTVPSPSNPTEPQISQGPFPANPIKQCSSPVPCPASPTEQKPSPQLSQSDLTDLQQSPEQSSTESAVLKRSPPSSPTNLTEFHHSPQPSSVNPTNLHQSSCTELQTHLSKSPLNSTVLCESTGQSLSELTNFQPVLLPAEMTELQESPVQSSSKHTELQQSPAPSPFTVTELQQSPAPSPSTVAELQKSPAQSRIVAELQQSPAPSNSTVAELQKSPAPSPLRVTELQKNPAQSPSTVAELLKSTAPSPSTVAELQQSPPPSPSTVAKLQKNLALYPYTVAELQQSPAPSPSIVAELQKSPAPSPSTVTELQRSPSPFPSTVTELQKSPAPSPSIFTELQKSPPPSPSTVAELQKNPAPSPYEVAELQQSPAPSPSIVAELQKSPAPSPSTVAELQKNPAPSPSIVAELQKSPAPSPSTVAELQKNPAPSPYEVVEPQQSPAPSPSIVAELQKSPAPSPSTVAELQQSPPPSPITVTELQKSPAPSPSIVAELQKSPAPSPSTVAEIQKNPAPSPYKVAELQQSPPPSPSIVAELQKSPAPSPSIVAELQKSPAPSPSTVAELQKSPAPIYSTVSELQKSPAPIYSTVSELQLSTTPSPATVADQKQCPAPSPSTVAELQKSPAQSSVAENKKSLVPSTVAEFQQSQVASPKSTESQENPIPFSSKNTELQESPIPYLPNPTEQRQSPVPSPFDVTEYHHNAVQCSSTIADLQQSPVLSPYDATELHHNPLQSPSNTTEQELRPAPSLDVTELQHCPQLCSSKLSELQQSRITSPSVKAVEECPIPSFSNSTVVQECLVPSLSIPTEVQESPVQFSSIPLEVQESPVPSSLNPTEVQESPVPSLSILTEDQNIVVPSPSNHTEVQESPLLSPIVTECQRTTLSFCNVVELQKSPAPSPSATAVQQSPVPSPSTVAELQQSPVSFPSAIAVQQSPIPSPSTVAELEQSPVPSPSTVAELQKNPLSLSKVTELQQSSILSPEEATELTQNSSSFDLGLTEVQNNTREPQQINDPSPEPQQINVPAPEPQQINVPAPEPQQINVPAPEPQQINVPTPEPQQINVPAPEPQQINVPAPEPQQINVPSPEPQQINVPPPEPQHINVPAPEPQQINVPAPEPQQIHVPAPEPQQINVPAPEPQQINVPAPEPQQINVPAPEPQQINVPAPEPQHINVPAPEPQHINVPAPEPQHINVASPETQQINAKSLCGAELQKGALQSIPLISETAGLQGSPVALYPNPIQVKENSQCNHGPLECKENHSRPSTPSHLSSDHLTSPQAQLSPQEMTSMDSTREQLMSRVPQKSPLHGSPMSELSPIRLDADKSKPQTISQNSRSCSPTDINIKESLLQTHQGSYIHVLHSPIRTSLDVEITLDEESLVPSPPSHLPAWAAQISSTLDQDFPPVSLKTTFPGRRKTACRPISAPCSPSRTPVSATKCSLSQPASPVQIASMLRSRPLQVNVLACQSATPTECSQSSLHTGVRPQAIPLSPNLNGQTLESVFYSPTTVMCTTTLTVQPSNHLPFHAPPSPAPESLVHQMEHSSLACMSSCAEKSVEQMASPTHIQPVKDGASPSHASEMPASPARSLLQASSDSMPKVSDIAVGLPLPASPVMDSSFQPAAAPPAPISSSREPTSTLLILPSHGDTTSSENEDTTTQMNPFSLGTRPHHQNLVNVSPEPPQLPQSVQSSPSQVQIFHSPTETTLVDSISPPDSPTHCRPIVCPANISVCKDLSNSESSIYSSNQSSSVTCMTPSVFGHISSTQSGETLPCSPADSISGPAQAHQRLAMSSSSPKRDNAESSQVQVSVICNSFQLGTRLGSTADTKPLSPLSQRIVGNPTQEPTDTPQATCTNKSVDSSSLSASSHKFPQTSPTCVPQDSTEHCSQRSPFQFAIRKISLSPGLTTPESSEAGTGASFIISVESGISSSPTSPGCAILAEKESTSLVAMTNDKEQGSSQEHKRAVQDQEEAHQEHVQEQEGLSGSNLHLSGVQLSPRPPAAASLDPRSVPSPQSPKKAGSPDTSLTLSVTVEASPSLKDHRESGQEDSCPMSWARDDDQSNPTKTESSEWVEEQPKTPTVTAAVSDEVSRQVDIGESDDRENQESADPKDQSYVEEEPLSPVLELDPSLDVEVMKLMTTESPPASFLHLSSFSPPPIPTRGKGRSLRPPLCSSFAPLDDLSLRLRQSPFSTEASPETSPAREPITPPPLSPPSPPLRFSPPYRESPPLSQIPPSTVIPLTPKIGMGKPAITKRKFSPGRARVRQGSWWSNVRAVSPPSSSQDSTGEGGRDSPKYRPPDSPLWSMRVGRGSGFPGRRRARGGGVGGGRGGRGRSRIKTQDFLSVSPAYGFVESIPPKEEEENSMHNTVVMFSTSDLFTLRQDMCVVCGSFGQGAEGRLLACSQCGQCYHPYCVNVKITRVILTKGWRCLECTVCEACGEASDPGRLLLCDDCDISYHTYCLDPPLHMVPKGAWKCKWCVWCVQCGSASPGLHCDWQSNYSRCAPCASLTCCPLCQRLYTQDDLILQCQQCDRWVHASCEGLTSEDEVEMAADEGFNCSLCRTHSRISFGRSDSLDSSYMSQIISRSREADIKTYTQDGVCLTESGLSHLQSLVEPLTSARRYRRCKPKLKLRIINQNSVSVLQTPPDPHTSEQDHHHRVHLDCDLKSDSSPERDHAPYDDVSKELHMAGGSTKRKRKPYRPGIGGFMVRQRGGKAGSSGFKLCRNDSTDMLHGDEDVADQTLDKVKKRYRKKKTKLEEAFPSYLQDAFFGRDLLERIRQLDQRMVSEVARASQSAAVDLKGPAPSDKMVIRKQERLPMSDDALVDLSDVLNTHPQILATGHTGQFQVERSPSPFAGLDIGSMAEDPLLTGSGGHSHRSLQEEPLDAILNPELDKMVTDGALLSKLYNIPELEGKDVEDLFTAVLSPDNSEKHHHHTAAGSKTHTAAVFPRLPLMNGLTGRAPHLVNPPMMPSGTPGTASHRICPPEGPFPGSAPCLPPANQAGGEGEQDALSTAQRSMLKWEKEEALGEQATVAPVLYCNTNFPQLKEQYPEWSTRVKQIAKLWRKASSQDRAPFVQRARDNRAAQRISKVHMSNEPLKRQQQQPLQPPLSVPYDAMSMESDLALKDPLRPRESEQEQEWKLRQGEVKDRWRAGKKRQENLPQSKALKSPTDKDCPFQASLAGGGKEALHLRQKSKQLAKIEASQKLEQVKNEQLLQQRQHHLSANQQPVTGSDVMPLQLLPSTDAQPRQNILQGSVLADNVFLRPQVPPSSGYSSLPHSPHSLSPLHQPPSSPQMFSPPSSSPTSPWDPYSKPAATSRPSSIQHCTPLNISPAHDALGSPAPSPDSKTSDASRTLGLQPGLQHSKAALKSPPSGSQVYQRSPVQGGVFKAPMPPQNQLQQELFSGAPAGARRDPSRPTDLGLIPPQSQDSAFSSSQLSGLGSPHRSPYAHTPGTPRIDYSQQMADHFVKQPALTPRPSPDPYSNPQTPGTPRPHSDNIYLNATPALRIDQFNQLANSRRPSPSHTTLDPYSNPGTPHSFVPERFPRSPGSTLTTDPHAKPPGTPRPPPDPYAQQPSTPRPQKTSEAFSQAQVESFTPQLVRSPLGSGLGGETVTLTPTHKQSPGRQQQQQDSYPRTPGSSQTPKHPGMSEDTGFPGPVSQTLGRPTTGPAQMDKTSANDMATIGGASLEGPMGLLPQLGDSEEKLRQRQRLRQLILRQQQQKSALRQEKGLQESQPGAPSATAAPPGSAPSSATPCHWSQEETTTPNPPTDVFGRPPPPYPGIMRPAVPAGAFTGPPRLLGTFPVDQVKGLNPSESQFPRQSIPRELGPRGLALRFGLQESFLRSPTVLVPGSGLVLPVQIRTPVPSDFTSIRQMTVPSPHPHLMSAVHQPFVPRSLPIQQHSIMGQPYIELRHRSPENRLRLPFSLVAPPVQTVDSQPSAARPISGVPIAETTVGHHPMLTMEQLNQQNLIHVAALGQESEPGLQGTDGIEEHLEGEDSAVKDLEDVEVKDLVDLNLNLDPEDGKEDLDLGANDLHLDDFLLSGKFDLIAYADPELNLEDKKDMFNEELDLEDPVGDKKGGERQNLVGGPRKLDTDVNLLGQVKEEVQEAVNRDTKNDSSSRHPAPQPEAVSQQLPVASEAETAGSSQSSSSLHLAKGDVGDSSDSGVLPELQAQEKALSSGVTPGQQPGFHQTPLGPSSAYLNPQTQASPDTPHKVSLQLSQPCLLLNPQAVSPNLDAAAQSIAQEQAQNKSKPLLLEEQPLLLQDLLDQERQEQQQQKQMQALIRQKSTSEPTFPEITDFDSISDPIMKAKMVALKGINKVMTQGNLGLNNMVINRFHQAPAATTSEGTPQPLLQVGQEGEVNPPLVRPNPPSCGPGFVNDSQKRQYEEWLGETQQLLQMQQRLLEDQIAAHRKTKKALSAKQRTAKKAGRALAEEDAAQLRYIVEQQGTVQKQLEQIRKQQKDHTVLIEDYRTQQQQQQQRPLPIVPSGVVPLQNRPSGSALPCVQNVPPGWSPAVGVVPGLMGPNMASHVPPQLPHTLSKPPQASQPSPAIAPRLSAPAAGFSPGPRTPTGGPSGASGGDIAAPSPQVKFDDNNPFSEGFQERERRERIREQQERQRVHLMQGVDCHRVLQQGSQGGSVGPGVARLCSTGSVAGSTPGSTPSGDTFSKMPFFSSELPQDFLQSPPASRPPQLLVSSPNLQTTPRLPGPLGSAGPGQVRPPGLGGVVIAPSNQGSQGHQFRQESSTSSPSAPLHAVFTPSSSGGPASLMQLYSDIMTDDSLKKKRSGNKDRDNSAGGARTPLSSHSDDITAPSTPAFSDASCSTPTRCSTELAEMNTPPLSGLAPSSELEKQLSVCPAAQDRTHLMDMEAHRGLLCGRMGVKEEREERGPCGGDPVKLECASPLHVGGDVGKELLRHLLKEKASPAKTPSPTTHALPPVHHQLSTDSVRSEEEDGAGFLGNMMVDSPDVLDLLGKKKAQRCKRAARPDKDKALAKYKRRKQEDEDEMLHSSSTPSEQIITHLRQLSVLPLMEPVLGFDLSLFPPYGSTSLGRDSRLTGSFGNACLDGVTDYYSQLTCKNNLGNPPTPPASLPPTPPPVVKQKLVNGFATAEELSRKELTEQDMKGIKSKVQELPAENHTAKTVDVPASLPTPPHNNQEELRAQESSLRSSPEDFVPSSSPDSVADMEISRYPDLSFIKLELPSPCPSPPIPIMPCSWGKGTAVKQEVKAEPSQQAPPSCSNTDLVTIAITLNPSAAQNVPGVMATVAKLLRVPTSINYQLSRAECNPLALLAGVRVPLPQASASSRQQRPAPPAGVRMDVIQHGATPAVSRPPSCSHCKVLLGSGVRKIKAVKQEGPSTLLFCSPNCSALYSSGLKTASSADKPKDKTPPDTPSRLHHHYANNMSSIAVHSLPRTPITPSQTATSSPPLQFPSASTVTMEIKPRVDSLKVKVKLKPHPHAFSEGDDLLLSHHGKRMKNSRWRRWNINVTLTRGPISDEAVAMPTEEEIDVMLKKLGASLRPDPIPVDQRRCCFCHQLGDGVTDGPARLLNLDLDLWVHLNCALWSSEVYETQAGALINVELALRRSLALRCAHCQQTGATSGCNRLRCTNTYHFTCALRSHCTFFKDKTMLCHFHKPRMAPLSGDRSSSSSPSSTPGMTSDFFSSVCDPYNSELRCFAVFRRVFVQRDEARQVAAMVQRGEQRHTFRVGSLLFCAVGRLLPQQMSAFHSAVAIFPVGYHANRIYWSMRNSNRRCKYMCFIEDHDGRPLFKVKVVEKGYDDIILTATTPKGVWDQILEPVSQLRSSSGTLKLFPSYLKGEDLFGLNTSAISRIVESLPGVEACERYTFRYGRNPLMEWPLAFNPSGSARSEPKVSQAKRPYLLTSMAPRCQGSVGSIVGMVPGVIALSPGETVAGAHQGRHSKSSQYRRMKAEWKTNVYLARSRIQGLGLYAARDIEKCTMVIEYIGAIIRSEVANRKERVYESQNRGVYMFRIDNDYVIDATITGGPARYINHSCAPNCITEVVSVEKENKIIISSCRRIQRGEELSYDYKFDLEDDQHKIPCHCGAFNCRKWMN